MNLSNLAETDLRNVSQKNEAEHSKAKPQISLSSISSFESAPEMINGMPIMTQQYEDNHFQRVVTPEETPLIPFEDSENAKRDVEVTAPDIQTEHETGSAHQNTSGLPDDLDHLPTLFAIPTREGREFEKDNADDVSGQDEVDAIPDRSDRTGKPTPCESMSLVSSSEAVKTPQFNEDHLCCRTICALFEWKHLFTKFSAIDLFFALLSTVLYIFDVITDILNAYSYYLNRDVYKENIFYFGFTMLLIVAPSLITQFFSLWWEAEDETEIRRAREEQGRERNKGCLYYFAISVSHVLQVATLFRYMRASYFGIKSRREEKRGDQVKEELYFKKWKYEYCDVSFLRLFDSFLEAAPQLVLQFYIMLTTMQAPFITVISCLASWGGLSTAFLSFQRSMRASQKNKKQLSIPASICLVLYRSFTILSRVSALALLLNVHIWAWIGLFLLHWFAMTLWIAWQGTNFCSSKPKEYIYDAVIGFCHNFAYINVNGTTENGTTENKTRMILYYFVMLFENCAIALIWLKFRHGGSNIIETLTGQSVNLLNSTTPSPYLSGVPGDIALVIVILIPAVFLLGMFFMLVYYAFLHPTIGWYRRGESANNNEDAESTKEMVETQHIASYQGIERSVHSGENLTVESWHSEHFEVNTTTKQPSPVKQSAGMLLSKPAKRTQNASIELEQTSAYCSCYSLHHETEIVSQPIPVSRENEHFAESSGDAKLTTHPQFEDYRNIRINEREIKKIHVEMLKKQKRNIEQEILKLNLNPTSPVKPLKSPTEELFDRKSRAKLLSSSEAIPSKSQLYGRTLPTSSKTSPFAKQEMVTKRLLPTSPLATGYYPQSNVYQGVNMPPTTHRKRLNSDDSAFHAMSETNLDAIPLKSGTFPRCAKRSDSATPGHLIHAQTLRPIKENKLSLHTSAARDYSASLCNLATSLNPTGVRKTKVPRALSFTVSKNEQVISIESAL